MSKHPIGVIHGRFQPPHLGHIEYLLAGKSRCAFLYIGIANPDPNLTAENSANLLRSRLEANPFTFQERLLMLRDSLLEVGIPRSEFEIVPFPINYPHLLKYYVPLDAHFFVTVYDDWGREKVKVLEDLGVKVEVMWERSMLERFTSGTEVRKLIAIGEEWQHLVPQAVVRIIRELKLDERVHEISKQVNN